MKKILLFFIILLSSITNITVASESENNDIKVRFFGHVYLEDRNTPIKNIKVYIIKNGEVLGENKTNKEGTFDFVIDNREDYLNLCIKSTDLSEKKNIDLCETVSIFQKAGRIVDGVEIREVEYTFITDENGKSLNQRLENEINNSSTEESFDEYEIIKSEIEQENKNKEAEEKKQKELDEKKAEYKMVNNTEMIGPLDTIQILGTVKDLDKKMQTERTYIRIVDHFGNILKETQLGSLQDFNITISPTKEKVFLHPLNLIIYNNQKQKINGNSYPLFQTEYRLVTKEKNVFNIELKKYKYNSFKDDYITQREKFPFLSIILILGLFFSAIILVIKNKNHNIRNL